MKKIGGGLQFDVYDFDKDNVLKIPKKIKSQYLIYLKWAPLLIFAPIKLRKLVRRANEDRELAIYHFTKNTSSKRLLGNPKFTKEGIVQNKVIPLSKLFGKSKIKDKELIDKYIKFIFSCWKNKFMDRIYNIDNNFGVDKKGNIVYLDFFEVLTKKEDILSAIKTKRWEKAAWYKYRIPRSLKKYYKEKMESNLTEKNLNKYWGKK